MNQPNGTSLWVWLTLGLIGLGLNAFAGLEISARIKDRPEALELYGTISNWQQEHENEEAQFAVV
jgi:hypothetical protein